MKITLALFSVSLLICRILYAGNPAALPDIQISPAEEHSHHKSTHGAGSPHKRSPQINGRMSIIHNDVLEARHEGKAFLGHQRPSGGLAPVLLDSQGNPIKVKHENNRLLVPHGR